MNNLHRVQNIFISDGTSLPSNDAAISAVTAGKIGVFGTDMTALNPAGGDTITTQPSIYIVEGKTNSDGVVYAKRSMRIAGTSVISYNAESYRPAVRKVSYIGYNRLTATGLIEINNDTNYNFSIDFKNDKWLYSARTERLNINFQSSSSSSQLLIATAAAGAINSSSFRSEIIAIVVGDGTGVYGVTGAVNFGVEIWGLDVNQFLDTTYTPNQVNFTVHVNDASGFGTTTTGGNIQFAAPGSGTYNQVYTTENKDFGYEGVTNRRLWPIPVLNYSSTSAYILSAAIAETVSGTISEDKVTFSATVAAKIRAGEKVELGGVNYEIKYFISTTVAILTTPLVGTLVAAAVKVRLKYDLVNIEFNDVVNTPTSNSIANKSVVIAVPAIDAGGAYNALSSAGTNLKAILDGWMTTTPLAPANISI